MISDIGAPVLKGGMWCLHHRMVRESGKGMEIETHRYTGNAKNALLCSRAAYIGSP